MSVLPHNSVRMFYKVIQTKFYLKYTRLMLEMAVKGILHKTYEGGVQGNVPQN